MKQKDWVGPQISLKFHIQSRVSYKIRPHCSRFFPAWPLTIFKVRGCSTFLDTYRTLHSALLNSIKLSFHPSSLPRSLSMAALPWGHWLLLQVWCKIQPWMSMYFVTYSKLLIGKYWSNDRYWKVLNHRFLWHSSYFQGLGRVWPIHQHPVRPAIQRVF